MTTDTRKRIRRPSFIRWATFGSQGDTPCLWESKAQALENREVDERVYRLRVTKLSEVPTPLDPRT